MVLLGYPTVSRKTLRTFACTQLRDRSYLTDDPALEFLSQLVEDFTDEWMTKVMFWFRWSDPLDAELFATQGCFDVIAGAEPLATAALDAAITAGAVQRGVGYGFPMGPLELTDLVGLDVRLSIAEYLHSELGDTFAPPRILRDKVEAGELGKKSGKGFYDWTE